MYTLGIDVLISRKEKTGVEWYTHYLIREMKKNTPENWRVFLYSLYGEDFTKDLKNDNWQWKQLAWPPRRFWTQFRLSYEMFRNRPNVLFSPHNLLPWIHPHSPKKSEYSVTTIHDVGALLHQDLYSLDDFRRQSVGLSLAKVHAEKIFVPTKATEKDLIKYADFSEDKIVVTPLGVDIARYHPGLNLENIKQKYNLKRPYLLYVGRIDAKKNLPVLLEAFEDNQEVNKDFDLVLAGSRNFKFKDEEFEIAYKKLGKKGRLLGYVPEEDLPALYCGANAFVFPSMYEGFGLPVIQALACGVPSLVSEISVLREVTHGNALFAPPTSLENWSSALSKIVYDNNFRETLKQRGPCIAEQYSWEACAKKTWQAIENLVY